MDKLFTVTIKERIGFKSFSVLETEVWALSEELAVDRIEARGDRVVMAIEEIQADIPVGL